LPNKSGIQQQLQIKPVKLAEKPGIDQQPLQENLFGVTTTIENQ
jgi:hypothetical protein